MMKEGQRRKDGWDGEGKKLEGGRMVKKGRKDGRMVKEG
jgi:hypothetical protein